ncbi:phosphopantetheine adenylyltransferase / dephospho-CoA kinase [Fistulifera solaris]|uniref:Phosphopantetheine adenylyltransferase / dephospho-CoA kinase n=1 Tax=Fistulifera solaris TaxID=1519565 RepID=A0A1Z5K7J0_FISSO|nr:phosphopantetheine adenylyltransferase / dephospho-CoA kinase [Fistulifera solaris]|eukprot:GAX22145.1 phosphopantetheine adenylyltransferase / dephospho-CoA kinase [Fistulifera solaris]
MTDLPLTRKVDNHPIKVLGVCGGIGSGKSAACKLLVSQLNALAHIDTDSIAHAIYEPTSPVVEQVRRAFGDEIMAPDGRIDRKKLGSIVFADRDAMRTLEAMVWPQVQSEIEKRIERIRFEWLTLSSNDASLSSKQPIIVVEAAVLLDAGWQHTFLDAVWVITVPQEVALQRMMENRGLSREEAMKRVEAQQSPGR